MTAQSRTFRIFVSSTFYDLKEERNALQERVFPRLRELCMQHGARFQAIDLRWGVSEEASLDQQTMNICLGEIARCQRTTPRPNFIVLLGDRYGWCPPPPQIPADEFEEILNRVADGDRDLLRAWYRRDENAVPAEYCLQPRQRGGDYEEYAAWEPVERRLHGLLKEATGGLDLDEDQRLKYEASATHQEIAAGALKVEDAPEHVFCFFRRVEGVPQDGRAEGFLDLVELDGEKEPDREARVRLENLKGQLSALLPANVRRYEAEWTAAGSTGDHIDQLCDDVYESLAGVIRREVALLEEVDPLDTEVSAHEAFGQERAKFFVGRAGILKDIRSYVQGTDPHPLAVWGESGSGKSALMAKATEHAQAADPKAEVVYRFIGATPDSSSGRALLESLCRQISRSYGVDESDIPLEFKDLAREFPKCLALATSEKPLILFLDALDQLSDADNARNLAWLPADLPEHVRLVVSTLPGECLSVLEGKLPQENLKELEPMPPEEGRDLLVLWLEVTGRTLQPHQEGEVLRNFESCSLPLYLKLAFEEALRWNSYSDPSEITLRSDVSGVIHDLLERLSLEQNHGELLVSRSLGYLTAAKNGLSEDEMIDILSLDEQVMADFFRRSPRSPEVDRLPVVVWSRLYFDLEPYLTQRSADSTALFSFYHRQLAEVTSEEYLSDEQRPNRHRKLAHYFASQPLYLERDAKKTPNLRKLSELPYQQTNAQMWDEVNTTLTDFEFLQSKVIALSLQLLIEDFEYAFNAGHDSQDLRLVHGALRLATHALIGDPTRIAGELTGRLLSFELPIIKDLLKQMLKWDRLWLRPLHPCLTPPGQALMYTLMGHTDNVTHVAVTPGGRRAVSTSADKTLRIWDLDEGIELYTLSGHTGRTPSFVVTPDGRKVLSAGDSLKIWDLDTGTQIASLLHRGHVITNVAVTRDSLRGLSAATDGTLMVWNLEACFQPVSVTNHGTGAYKILITPDNRYSITFFYDNSIKICELDTSKERATLIGHTSLVMDVAVTPDGYRAISASNDKTLKIWDLNTGKELVTLSGHNGTVWSVDITPDGRRVISSSEDMTLKVWDTDTGKELITLSGHRSADNRREEFASIGRGRVGILSVRMSHDGRYAVSASSDGMLKVWDLDTCKEQATLIGHEETVTHVAITNDDRLVISASKDGALMVWDLNACKKHWRRRRISPLAILNGHTGRVVNLVVSPNGRQAASYSEKKLKLWDLKNCAEIASLDRNSAPALRTNFTWAGVALTNHRAISVSSPREWNNTLKLWDIDTGKTLAVLSDRIEHINSAAITADGRRAVSVSSEGTYRIWDLDSFVAETTLSGHAKGITKVVLTHKGNRAVSSSHDTTLKVWDLDAGAELATLSGHQGGVLGLAMIEDGKRVVSFSSSFSKDNTLKVWDLETKSELATMTGHTRSVNSIAITPDGERVISGSGDKTIKVWDLDSGSEIATLTGHTRGVNNVVITPDGEGVISGSGDKTIKVWDLNSGSEVATFAGHAGSVNSVALVPDGRRMISASSDNTLKVWDLGSQAEISTHIGHTERLTCITITPDGRRAVSGSDDCTLKVWDLDTGRELTTLSGHIYDDTETKVLARLLEYTPSGVTQVLITPDGQRAISAAVEKTLKVWDLGTGTELATLSGHNGRILMLAMTADGHRAVTGSTDKTLKIWDLEAGAELNTISYSKIRFSTFTITPDGKRAIFAVFPDGDRGTTSPLDRKLTKPLKVWDLEEGIELLTLSFHICEITAVAVTHDNRQAISADKCGRVILWDLDTGKSKTLGGHIDSKVYDVALTPDNKLAVTASKDNTLKIWDLSTRKELATLTGHTDDVTKITIARNGHHALSLSKDNSIRVWDLASARSLATFNCEGSITCGAIAPDGMTIAAGGETGRVYILRMEGLNQCHEYSTGPLEEGKSLCLQ